MAHDKVFGICTNKCLVEVAPKEAVDGFDQAIEGVNANVKSLDGKITQEVTDRSQAVESLDAAVKSLDGKITQEVTDRSQAIAGLEAGINQKVTRQIINVTNKSSLYTEIVNMNIGDELVFSQIGATPVADSSGYMSLAWGFFKKTSEGTLNGSCYILDRIGSTTNEGICHAIKPSSDKFYPTYRYVNSGKWTSGNNQFNAADVTTISNVTIIKYS